jgi:hypothetical protein
MLSAYTETTLNSDFKPKSAIISINTNTKKKNFLILTNYIIRDGLSQKTISRYCPFKQLHCQTLADRRTKGVGPGTILAWPGWKQPDISVKMDTARLEAGQLKKCCMECVLL